MQKRHAFEHASECTFEDIDGNELDEFSPYFRGNKKALEAERRLQAEHCEKLHAAHTRSMKSQAQQEKYGAEIAKAEAARKQAGMAPLKGTAAQKKWAEQLRQAFITSNPELRGFVSASKTLGKARVWIDTRRDEPRELRQKIVNLKAAEERLNSVLAELSACVSKKFPDLQPGDKFPLDEELIGLFNLRDEANKQLLTAVSHFSSSHYY